MKRTAEYTLRRAAGGTSHFARVTLVLAAGQDRLESIRSLERGLCPSLWVRAARKGALAALQEVLHQPPRGTEVAIADCVGAPADTDVDTMWCAGFLAALDAGDSQRVATPFFDGVTRRWHVRLDGIELRPPLALLEHAAHRP